MKVLIVSGIIDRDSWRSFKPSGDNVVDKGPRVFHIRTSGPYVLKDSLIKHGIGCDILDFFSFWDKDDLKRWCLNSKEKYDLIGFTATFSHSDIINDTLAFFKQYWPDAITLTGCMNSLQGVETDYMVYGFAEEAFIQIINHEFFQEDLKYTLKNNTKYVNAYKDYFSIKNDYSYKLYKEDGWDSNEPAFFEINRGCRFKCKFCTFPLLGIKEDTSGSEQSYYDTLKRNYEEFGKINYNLSDDTANNRTSSLVKLRNAVNRLNFQPMFSGFVRPDLVIKFPEQRELMAEIGLIGHQYGIETFKHSSAKAIGKGMDPNRIKEYLLENYEYYSKHNLKSFFSAITMIAGLPGESVEEMRESHQWLETNFGDNPNFWVWWFPLSIEDNSLESGTGSISDFSVNSKKYGYRIVESNLEIEDHERRVRVLPWANFGLNWENDFTTFSEVASLCSEFNRYDGEGDGVWRVPYWFRYYKDRNKIFHDNHVDKYIKFKLSELN